jgi:hypothetical protein
MIALALARRRIIRADRDRGRRFIAAMTTLVVTERGWGRDLLRLRRRRGRSCVHSRADLVSRSIRAFRAGAADRRLFLLALAFAVVFRAPLAARVNAGSDMFRRIWDGRVQRFH